MTARLLLNYSAVMMLAYSLLYLRRRPIFMKMSLFIVGFMAPLILYILITGDRRSYSLALIFGAHIAAFAALDLLGRARYEIISCSRPQLEAALDRTLADLSLGYERGESFFALHEGGRIVFRKKLLGGKSQTFKIKKVRERSLGRRIVRELKGRLKVTKSERDATRFAFFAAVGVVMFLVAQLFPVSCHPEPQAKDLEHTTEILRSRALPPNDTDVSDPITRRCLAQAREQRPSRCRFQRLLRAGGLK